MANADLKAPVEQTEIELKEANTSDHGLAEKVSNHTKAKNSPKTTLRSKET